MSNTSNASSVGISLKIPSLCPVLYWDQPILSRGVPLVPGIISFSIVFLAALDKLSISNAPAHFAVASGPMSPITSLSSIVVFNLITTSSEGLTLVAPLRRLPSPIPFKATSKPLAATVALKSLRLWPKFVILSLIVWSNVFPFFNLPIALLAWSIIFCPILNAPPTGTAISVPSPKTSPMALCLSDTFAPSASAKDDIPRFSDHEPGVIFSKASLNIFLSGGDWSNWLPNFPAAKGSLDKVSAELTIPSTALSA